MSLNPSRSITSLKFVVESYSGKKTGLAEMVVDGPPDVDFSDQAPPVPTNLKSTDGIMFLQWDYSFAPDITGYKIYYGPSSGNYTSCLDVGNVSWFLMRDLLEDGLKYYLAVKSYNNHNIESLYFSNEVSAKVKAPKVLSITPDSGTVGGFTPVTIKGRNFASKGVKVYLGGEHALQVKVVDDRTITALTHWHRPGIVDVKVLNPDDLFGILYEAFTYTVNLN